MDDARLEVWDVIARWRAAGRRFVLATVVATRGFTPQKGGAHLLVAEGGEIWGTVGGGAIEQEVLARARTLLSRGGADRLDRHRTEELGMCCGGAMSVFLEVVERAPRLVIFGAGHIAKPLASIAAGCGFDVTVVDARADWASQERFPWARLEIRAPEDFAREWRSTGDEFVVIVTHDHALDQKLVHVM